VIAVMLALLSLSLKWYSFDVTYEGETGDYVRTCDLYLSYWEFSALRSYQYGFEEANYVIDGVVLLILVWSAFSLLFLSAVASGGSGFVRGWLLILFAVLPLMVYGLFITDAVNAELSGSSWSLPNGAVETQIASGPVLVVLAAILQVTAVVLRNVQVLSSWMSTAPSGETT